MFLAGYAGCDAVDAGSCFSSLVFVNLMDGKASAARKVGGFRVCITLAVIGVDTTNIDR